ncbi:MAG: hypothetical protein HXY50_16305 [Ignavibacteriaceae bacterium]|nr:hypothetical protein [Ignavibacteriaceae bacterium]
MNVVTVLNVILLISASALCIALIYYLYKITKSFEEIKNHVNELASDMKPLISSTTELSERLSMITSEASGQIQMTRDMVNSVKLRVDKILGFEEKVRRGIEEPVLSLVRNVSAIVNGVNAFWNSYRKH